VAAERTRRIEIEEFVALDDIDPIHWESTYYLAPDKTAGKPYALLLAALESTSRVGLGRVVLRSKEYLAAIRPARDALMLSTMLFADEIVPRAAVEEFGEEPAEVSPKELAIAEQLVGSLSADWDPDRYKDTYRERVLDLVKAKAAGREIVEHAEAEPAARVDDLMAALEASLAAATKQATAKKAPAKKAAAKPRRAAAPKKS
jgi:DNA end-binding protein Ku